MTASSTRPGTARSTTPATRDPDGGLGHAERIQLLDLSDSRGLADLAEASARVAMIAEIFAEHTDPRGVFPLIYRIGLDEVVAAMHGGRFSNPDWVQTFDVAFAKRYLDNLHRHLREQQTTPPWQEVYRRADVQTASTTAILAASLNAHLITDLPEALHASGVRHKHAVDFQTLSGLIWATAPNAITAIDDAYRADLSSLYHAAPLIWPVSVLGGRAAATTQRQLFNTISAVAFSQALAMANPLTRPLIRAQIAATSGTLAVVARSIDLAG
jgi:Family of unknown function (DUF5995)